jgi:multidrug resistance efflux pump
MHKDYNHNFRSFEKVYRYNRKSKVRQWFWGIMAAMFLLLLLPWTQNIRGKGTVTTLYQDQRPQQLVSQIPGKIQRWYIKEGDFVKKGDTLVMLGEVKDDYLDPSLIARTKEQIEGKSLAVEAYKGKAKTAEGQTLVLAQQRTYKISQINNKIAQQQNKINMEENDLIQAKNDYAIADTQYKRSSRMHEKGLISLVQLEQRRQSFINASVKLQNAERDLENAKQEARRLELELRETEQEYADKILKAEGERFSAISNAGTGQSDVAKLELQKKNYELRSSYYYVLAPQDGQVVQAKKAGLNEIVKEGELLAEIVPVNVNFAVEMYVRPIDLPLIKKEQPVRLFFDGYPAIVFSGWPNSSYGTFGGKVIAVETNRSDNGLFRVLVIPDEKDPKKWPADLKLGTGAQGFALLKNVPLWYELWRQINGFPPDYYDINPAKHKK